MQAHTNEHGGPIVALNGLINMLHNNSLEPHTNFHTEDECEAHQFSTNVKILVQN